MYLVIKKIIYSISNNIWDNSRTDTARVRKSKIKINFSYKQ